MDKTSLSIGQSSVFQDLEDYGLDDDAPLPDDIDSTEAVVVPEITCPLREQSLGTLRATIDPLHQSY